MTKEIIAFPDRERLWIEQNNELLEGLIKEALDNFNSRTEVLDEEAIAPGSSRFYKKILKKALDKEKQHDFNIEELYETIKNDLKELFYSIHKEYKINHDLKGAISNDSQINKNNKGKIKNIRNDKRGAFIERSLPSGDR